MRTREPPRLPRRRGRGPVARVGEEGASRARGGAEDEDAGQPMEDEDVGAASCAEAEDEDEDTPRELEKRVRSDGRRTVGGVAQRSAWRGSGDA